MVLPPVALAILFRSTFLHRLTAIAPASTKYFKHKSSIPPVVKMTLAPAANIFSILSFVMSYSLLKQALGLLSVWFSFLLQNGEQFFLIYLCRTPSNWSGFSIKTWTPIFILVFCKLKSKQAILAPTIFFTMANKTKTNDINVHSTQKMWNKFN